MLTAKGIVRRYGALVAVDGVDIEVPGGSCFGLLGPNGAGKTSLIGVLVGLVTPDAGTVMLDGEPVSPQAHATRSRIGYVPQELALYDEITARDNLRFFAGLYGLAGAMAEERIHEALEIAGLQESANRAVRTFSGGMKRRLNLVAGLLHRPSVLVMDEPTVGVDPQSRNAIFETVERLVAKGLTCVYTSHYMEEVERLCDNIAIMDGGKVVAQGDKKTLEKLLPRQRAITLVFETSTEAEAVAARLRDTAAGVQVDDTQVVAEFHDLGQALASVAAACAQTPPLEMHSRAPSLEEVFLQLTGKSLRD